ncbi:MAG: SH3 domain-containing protein [Anaerolineae bacterium]
MKKYLTHHTITRLTLCAVILFLIAGCQIAKETSISSWLDLGNPTLVSFPLTAAAQSYSFSADPGLLTQITLTSITPDLPYSANVHDSSGKLIASLVGGDLRDATLTVAPGSGLYAVDIKTDNHDLIGMLSVQLNRSAAAPSSLSPASFKNTLNTTASIPFQSVANLSSAPKTTCAARSSVANNINIRSGPGTNFGVIGMLAVDTTIAVVGQTSTGWYQVEAEDGGGWVSASVTELEGQCVGLLNVVPSNQDDSTAQAGIFNLQVDRDGWGNVSNHLVYSDLNRRHLILLAITNMSANPPDNYREFTLTLLCNGTGTDYVRWGAPESPTQICGSTAVIPVTTAYNQQWIAVTLPDTRGLSNVNYTLTTSRKL